MSKEFSDFPTAEFPEFTISIHVFTYTDLYAPQGAFFVRGATLDWAAPRPEVEARHALDCAPKQ